MKKRILFFSCIWIGLVLFYYAGMHLWKWEFFTFKGWFQVLLAGGIILISILIQKIGNSGVKTYFSTLTLRMIISLLYLVGLGLWLRKEAVIPILTYSIAYFFFVIIEALIHFLLMRKAKSR